MVKIAKRSYSINLYVDTYSHKVWLKLVLDSERRNTILGLVLLRNIDYADNT